MKEKLLDKFMERFLTKSSIAFCSKLLKSLQELQTKIGLLKNPWSNFWTNPYKYVKRSSYIKEFPINFLYKIYEAYSAKARKNMEECIGELPQNGIFERSFEENLGWNGEPFAGIHEKIEYFFAGIS